MDFDMDYDFPYARWLLIQDMEANGEERDNAAIEFPGVGCIYSYLWGIPSLQSVSYGPQDFICFNYGPT